MIKEIKVFTELSIDDIEKFEKGLIRWSELEGQNSNMIFEEKSLQPVRKELAKLSGYGYGIIYTYTMETCTKKMETPSLSIFWESLAENKCILKKIVFKTGNKELYVMTNGWKGTQLWYGC